ncbi:MAG: bifunctional glutamate N-acetyltransferase/amino-acid acetyltransferase ArgJ [Solobacterium sp.]|nr:bifunctional glutamate N-acetyltransferase/amino-acid acetyltransferase ArgJ [Solobacterium sp.]
MKWIEGGVCAPKGFEAAGMHCGIRPNRKKNDLALIVSKTPCTAAGMFTKNIVKAAPVQIDQKAIQYPTAHAILANSGIANACAPHDMENGLLMQKAAADALGIACDEVLIGSTGVIGQDLPGDKIAAAIPELLAKLTSDASGSDEAASAIMTTDTVKKEFALEFEVGGKTVHIGGISKGSGMIHPNMGTMLCYLTTDCAISKDMLKKALKDACDASFHRISVDGDTSTNDTLLILANGEAGNPCIQEENDAYDAFYCALKAITQALAKKMARDGEGAKHLITCKVSSCASEAKAEVLGKSVIGSSLTKAAIFGEDANWGRVLCALGYSGEVFDPEKVDIAFASTAGTIAVCAGGKGLAFDEELAKQVLHEDEVIIDIAMNEGEAEAVCWGCDLTYDYVKINGDYRT